MGNVWHQFGIKNRRLEICLVPSSFRTSDRSSLRHVILLRPANRCIDKSARVKGDWDSTSSYGLGDVHNAMAVLQLAADYLKQAEGDVTRDA